MPIENRPIGIECHDWKAREEGKKRCAYYMPPNTEAGELGALCSLDRHFLCSEWERANKGLIEAARLRAKQKKDPFAPPPPLGSQGDLFGGPPSIVAHAPVEVAMAMNDAAMARAVAAALPANGTTNSAHGVGLEPRPYRPAKDIPKEDVAALKAMGVEICLSAKGLPDVWLVPERRDSSRFEMTFEEAATLRLLVDAFPGARIIDLLPNKQGAKP